MDTSEALGGNRMRLIDIVRLPWEDVGLVLLAVATISLALWLWQQRAPEE